MKRTLRNLVIGAVMAATVITASTTAFAGQFVQTDMNFRSGASKASASTGCASADEEVEVLNDDYIDYLTNVMFYAKRADKTLEQVLTDLRNHGCIQAALDYVAAHW